MSAQIIQTTDGRSFIETPEGWVEVVSAPVNAAPVVPVASAKDRKAAAKALATEKAASEKAAAEKKPFVLRDAWKEQAATDPQAARMLATCLRYRLVKPAEVAKITRFDLATRIAASIAASAK